MYIAALSPRDVVFDHSMNHRQMRTKLFQKVLRIYRQNSVLNSIGSGVTEKNPRIYRKKAGQLEESLQQRVGKWKNNVTLLWCHNESSSLKYLSLSASNPRTKRSPMASFKTPPASPSPFQVKKSKKNFRVQFGSPSAAEYQIDEPSVQLTPMPSDIARERFSMDPKKLTQEEEEVTLETKQNSSILDEWEQSFEEDSRTSSRRRRRKNRRSSAKFTPSPLFAKQNAGPRSESEISPSVAVMENLASMQMSSSPQASSDASTISGGIDTTTHVSMSDSATSFLSISPDGANPGNSTSEFRIDLKAVNSLGGAMDVTPSRKEDRCTPSLMAHTTASNGTPMETTPPPTNVSLDDIHSFGGADPSSTDKTGLSPISRLLDASSDLQRNFQSIQAAVRSAL